MIFVCLYLNLELTTSLADAVNIKIIQFQLKTHLAPEALLVPLGVQRHHRFVGDRPAAALALGREHVLEVLLAVRLAVALEERRAGQRLAARAAAREVVLVPAVAQRLDHFLHSKTEQKNSQIVLRSQLLQTRRSALPIAKNSQS